MTGLVFASPAALNQDRPDADAELVLRLSRAEPGAVGEAYDAHHAAVRAFAQRLLGETGSAEDLVHEVFVTLPRAARNFRGEASLRTFLISIAVEHARHFVRAARAAGPRWMRLEAEPAGTTYRTRARRSRA